VQTKVLIMRPGEPHETRTFELAETPTYRDLAGVIEALLATDTFEHVTVLADFAGGVDYQPADMFVDEMGHQKALPFNAAATAIYRRNALLNQGVEDPEELSWIAGPAVLFERRVWR
jgi:hypothetical protein